MWTVPTIMNSAAIYLTFEKEEIHNTGIKKKKPHHKTLNRNSVLIKCIEYTLRELEESYPCHPTQSMNQNIVL